MLRFAAYGARYTRSLRIVVPGSVSNRSCFGINTELRALFGQSSGNDGKNNGKNDEDDSKVTKKEKHDESSVSKSDSEDPSRTSASVSCPIEPERLSEDMEASDSSDTNAVARVGVGDQAPKIPHVFALPLRRPVFPWFIAHMATKDQAIVRALKQVKQSRTPYVGLFMEKNRDELSEVTTAIARPISELHGVGSFASLQTLTETPDGGVGAWFLAHRRIRILEALNTDLPPTVKVHHVERKRGEASTDMVRALSNEILHTIRNVVRINPMMKEQMQYFMQRLEVHDAYKLADFAASMTNADPTETQAVLEAESLQERLEKALELLHKEEELSKLQQRIQQRVDEQMKESQRKYFLHEQLKTIKKELGIEKDDKDALVQKFKDRVQALEMPSTARAVFDEELEKLEVLERNSSEFNVTRSYLDWLTSLPWSKYSVDNFDLVQARSILDEDHYGMTDVKERILEFIAVGKLKGSVQGKIMCLVGPPGVGKTSIGKSIARALDRHFYRFSVGGLNDVAEIKGHRRTYVGAMPGKLIQCLKTTGVSNPLVLIDEVDKIGSGRYGGGDPASALLEMLDPNQNSEFVDHYLDTPVDASKVLFLCTANTTDSIPGPLLDRMEVIRLSGYDGPEKVEIAKRYLDPKSRVEVGLESDKNHTPKSLQLHDDAIQALIRWYCRESGVRNLEKHIAKIYRKAALKIVSAREAAESAMKRATGNAATNDENNLGETEAAIDTAQPNDITTPNDDERRTPEPGITQASVDAEPVDVRSESGVTEAVVTDAKDPDSDPLPGVDDVDWGISEANLSSYVGKPVFTSDRLYELTPPGVVMGLAWTSMGGSALYIECTTPNTRVTTPKKSDSTEKDHGIADISKNTDSNAPVEYTGSLKLTGKMGEVMQESAAIAHTLARRKIRDIKGFEDSTFLERAAIHMHVPEGATPKDGPSAGCTMTTALLSLATDMPVRNNLAMTGEISLTGKVLAIGGVKEKTMAARRSGVTTLIFPEANRKDFEELADHLKEGLEVHFASTYDDVFRVAFDQQEH